MPPVQYRRGPVAPRGPCYLRPMRTIYTCPVPSTWCPVCGKVVKAARDLGVDFQRKTAWFPRSRRTEVIRLSGQNRVPIIVEDDGFVMHESAEIVKYLRGKYGSSSK